MLIGALTAIGYWLGDRHASNARAPKSLALLVLLICLALGTVQLLSSLPISVGLPEIVFFTAVAMRRAPAGRQHTLAPAKTPLWCYAYPFLSALIAGVRYNVLHASTVQMPRDQIIPLLMMLTSAAFVILVFRAIFWRS